MKDENQTKEQLINGLVELRHQITELEASEATRKEAEEALRESEQRVKAMLESIGDHMSMMDKDLNIIWANEVAKRIFGDDIVGKKCYATYHKRTKPCEPYPCLTLRAFQDGKVHEHDAQVIDKDGKIVDFHCTANVALWDRDGKPAAVIEISRDITEGKRVEEALRKAEEKFRIIFENANDEIIYVDKYGKIIAVNQRGEDIFGYNQSEVIGKNFTELDIFESEDAPKITKLFRDALKGGEVVSLTELEVKHKNGNKIPVEVSTRPIKKNGELEGFLNIVRDITARKQTEKELQQVSREQKELLNKVRAMIFWIDKRGKFVRVNEAFASALDKTPDEIKGRSLYDLYPRELAQAFVRDNLEVIKSGIPKRSIEEPVETPKGTMWVSTSKIPYRDVDGNIAGIIGFSIDITERKRAEEGIKAKSLFLESLIEQSPLPTFVIDSEGICLMVNKAFLKVYNVPKKEMVLGRNALTEPANVRQGVVKYIKEALSGKVVETPEIEFISPYEKKRTVTKSKLFPIFDATNKLTNVVVMHEDITAQVQVGRALRKSEEKYRSLFQNARDVIVTFDLKGNVTSINKAIAEYGFKEAEFVGKNMLTFVSKKYWPRLLKELAKIIQGKPIEGEIEITTPKGKKIAEYKSNPIREGKKIIGLQTILRDITERKRAMQELKRYKFAVESAHDAIFFKDSDSRYIIANAKTLEAFGLSREEVIGKNDYELMTNRAEAKKNVEDDQLVLKTGKSKHITKHMTAADGKEYWFHAIKVPQFDEKGNILGLIGIARDITERKRAGRKGCGHQNRISKALWISPL